MENPESPYLLLHIDALSAASGATQRRIRHYIQSGLLPPPCGKGRGARYTQEHLVRLQQLLPLTEQGMSASAIKRAMGDGGDLPNERLFVADRTRLVAIYDLGFLQLQFDRASSRLTFQQEKNLVSALSKCTTDFLRQVRRSRDC